MKENKEHSKLKSVDEQSKAFFTGGKFSWSKSETAIWSEMEGKLNTGAKVKRISFNSIKYAVAAVLMVLVGTTLFFRFYTTTIDVPAGQHRNLELPDGSKIKLNASSSISYKPHWWDFQRQLHFEGEAFFEVEKGKKFTVRSTMGTTEVLGTSFNIFSREEVYKVTCLTGKVKVTSPVKKSVILLPNSQAKIKPNGTIAVEKDINTFPEISWRQNIFLFTATPIHQVIDEIERQYGVKIRTNIQQYALYSGNFTKENDVETVLGFICPAMGLSYEKTADDQYLVIQDSE